MHWLSKKFFQERWSRKQRKIRHTQKEFWKNPYNEFYSKLRKKRLSQLTNKDYAFLRKIGAINGCGGRSCLFSQKLAKFFSGFFFKASCEKHDFGYWKGGSEDRRKECDKKFLAAMISDVNRQFILFRPYFYIIAYCFYGVVRIFWQMYFNYK